MSKRSTILLFLLALLSCTKQGDCFTIRKKVILNGVYYLLNRAGDDLVNENVLVNQVIVPAEIYNDYSVGEQYCKD